MKKTLLSVMMVLSLHISFAQNAPQESSTFRKSDLLFDPFWLIGGLAFNASYERILSEDSGLGVNAIFGFGDSLDDFTQISPYYRAYFGSRYASGFYIEGFIPITVKKDYEWDIYGNESASSVSRTTGGVGFGLGGKWVAKKKFVFDLNIGIGRKFIGNPAADDEVTGKGMIGIGFCF